MSNRLIVGIVALLLLAGCCMNSEDASCTPEEHAAAVEHEKPKLLAEKDGVRLYQYVPIHSQYPVYFTTPCGDVQWNEHHGKSTNIQKQVNGTGCRQ